jgi:lysophospholipase L1-like esterase
MKFTDTSVNGTATSESKIPCETASEKGYLTPSEIVIKGGNIALNTAIAEDPAATRAAAELGTAATKNTPQPISYTITPHGDAATWTVAGMTHIMTKGSYVSPPYKVSSLSMVFASFRPAVSGIFTTTAKVIVRAAIEYPSGTLTPVYFNGKRDAVIETGGSATTDPCTVEIPPSTQYWVRVFAGTPDGDLRALPSCMRLRTGDGNGLNIGTPGIAATATLTASAGVINAVTLTAAGAGYPPNTEVACVISGAGTGADITAFVNASGSIDPFFRINNGGTGYTGTPTVAIPGNATGTSSFALAPSDKTLLGTVSGSTAYTVYGPSVIRANRASNTGKRSYVLIGDSITVGYYDTPSNVDGWARRASVNYGASFVNCGIGGATANATWDGDSQNWQQVELADGCTDAIVALGINDFNSGQTLAQVQASITALVGRLQDRGFRVSACTLTPCTTTSNVPKAWEADRVAYNEWLRTRPLGLDQVFETADTLETARNSGVWKASHMNTGEASYIHPNATGYDAMALAFAGIIISD